MFVNFDMLQGAFIEPMIPSLLFLREGLMSAVLPEVVVDPFVSLNHEASDLQYVRDAYNGSTYFHPHSLHLQPVYEELNDHDSNIVGVLFSLIPWDIFMSNLIPKGVTGIIAVLHNTCEQNHTYFLDGHTVRKLFESMFIFNLHSLHCFFHINRHNILGLEIYMILHLQIQESMLNFLFSTMNLHRIHQDTVCTHFHCINRRTFHLKQTHPT
jgi:hypothetical protein